MCSRPPSHTHTHSHPQGSLRKWEMKGLPDALKAHATQPQRPSGRGVRGRCGTPPRTAGPACHPGPQKEYSMMPCSTRCPTLPRTRKTSWKALLAWSSPHGKKWQKGGEGVLSSIDTGSRAKVACVGSRDGPGPCLPSFALGAPKGRVLVARSPTLGIQGQSLAPPLALQIRDPKVGPGSRLPSLALTGGPSPPLCSPVPLGLATTQAVLPPLPQLS